MVAHKSKKLQAEADKKSVEALRMAANFCLHPDDWILHQDIDIIEALHEVFMQGMSLADDLRQRNERTGSESQRVYLVMNDDDALFFFMGTVESILKRLSKLENAYV